MSDVRILFLSMDRDKRIANHFDDFRNALCRYADVTVLKHKIDAVSPNDQHNGYLSGKIKYVKMLPKSLDYHCVICDCMFLWMFEDWSKVKIPVFTIIEDQHNDVPRIQVDFSIKHNHIILHRYQFNKFHTNLPAGTKKLWFPHSVNTNVFKDWRLPKQYGVLASGSMTRLYNTRIMVKDALKDESIFTHIQRPVDYTENPWPVGKDYSKELNKAWLSVCCGAEVQYPIMKHFEIPASKSVLYGDYFPELGDLGFEPNKNMIIVDKKNIKDQVTQLLNDKDRLNRIAQEGYNLIQNRHTNDIRAKEMVTYIRYKILF